MILPADHTFDRHDGHQPLDLHAAFPLLEEALIEGEEFVPLCQLLVAPLARMQPGGEAIHGNVAKRNVHQLANQRRVTPGSFEQPELKPDILHSLIGIPESQPGFGRDVQHLNDAFHRAQVGQFRVESVLEVTLEHVLRPLARLAQIADQAIELGEVLIKHFPVAAFERGFLSSENPIDPTQPKLFSKISNVDGAPPLYPVSGKHFLFQDRLQLTLNDRILIDRFFPLFLSIQKCAEWLGHEIVFLIGRRLADIIVDVVAPPLRLALCLVFGQGAVRHGFAKCVVRWDTDDCQHVNHRPNPN